MIGYSQVGYHPDQEKVAVIELDKNDTPQDVASLLQLNDDGEWIEKYDVWRVYVFGLMSKRLADVIATVEEIAFRRVDVRIAEFLSGLTEEQEHITITHQEIACELGTAREVVSRILKDFERENIISQSRGSIIIQNKHALLERINSP